MRIELNTSICPIVVPDTYGTNFQSYVADDAWDDFVDMLCSRAEIYIKEAIRHTKTFKNCRVIVDSKLYSPKYYNYETDWMEFTIDIPDDIIDNLEDILTDDFYRYIRKFGSRDGFVSNYPIDEDDVLETLELGSKSNKFELLIAEIILWDFEKNNNLKKYQDRFMDEVINTAFENGYFEDEFEDEEDF